MAEGMTLRSVTIADPADPPMLIEQVWVVSCAACGRLGDWKEGTDARDIHHAHRQHHAQLDAALHSRAVHLADTRRRFEAGEITFDEAMAWVGSMYDLNPLPTWDAPSIG